MNSRGVETFLLDQRRFYPQTLRKLALAVRAYLDWLSEEGEIPTLDLSEVIPPSRDFGAPILSTPAREYMKFLPAVIKPSSAKSHRTGLVKFFEYLRLESIDEDRLERSHMETWFKSLAAGGLAPATRQAYILRVHCYLRWRHSNGAFAQSPDRLILVSDLPKRPKLLPRPFAPEIDAEIQCRLRHSDQLAHKAILLLRRTGMRANELYLLPENCLQRDPGGNSFLKVPLGKMNNERLVPLDAETLALVGELRDRSVVARGGHTGRNSREGFLVHGPSHKHTFYSALRDAFRVLTEDLSGAKPAQLHRLRHTYATEMISAGMSLYGVMHLLGHRHVGTTLIYAGIVQETVREEFFAAMAKIQNRYSDKVLTHPSSPATPLTPQALADDLARSLRRLQASSDPRSHRELRRLIKRIDRMREDLKELP